MVPRNSVKELRLNVSKIDVAKTLWANMYEVSELKTNLILVSIDVTSIWSLLCRIVD